MYLYYTTSAGAELPQNKPELSLGGFKSSNRVDNGELNNLFPDISLYTVSSNNKNKYVGLVLKNETGAAITNVKLWFEYGADCYSILNADVVDMAQDASGNLQMEHVRTVHSKPLYAEFIEANVDNKLDIGDLGIGEQVGIWIEQILKLDYIKSDMEDVYMPDPSDPNKFVGKTKNTEDTIRLKISWD